MSEHRHAWLISPVEGSPIAAVCACRAHRLADGTVFTPDPVPSWERIAELVVAYFRTALPPETGT